MTTRPLVHPLGQLPNPTLAQVQAAPVSLMHCSRCKRNFRDLRGLVLCLHCDKEYVAHD